MRTGWNVMPSRPFWKLKDADSGRKWGFKRSTLEVPKFSLLGGWPTPLKILVSWDDYSQYDGKITNVPNHQPVLVFPEIAGKLWWSASCLQGATFQRAVGGLPKRHITETVGGTYQCKPHGCFLKLGYPQIIHLNRVFHHKSSILGYPHFRNPPMCQPKMAQNSSPRLAAHRPSFQIAEARVSAASPSPWRTNAPACHSQRTLLRRSDSESSQTWSTVDPVPKMCFYPLLKHGFCGVFNIRGKGIFIRDWYVNIYVCMYVCMYVMYYIWLYHNVYIYIYCMLYIYYS